MCWECDATKQLKKLEDGRAQCPNCKRKFGKVDWGKS